jgi:putative hydrolase of the HAD superfamily
MQFLLPLLLTMDMCFEPVAVFDLDDTLYPESAFVAGGFRAVGCEISHQYEISGAERVLFQVQKEGYRGGIFNETLRRLGITCSEGDIERFVRIYREHQPNICLFPDAASTLMRLGGRIPLAMISDGWELIQRRKLRALGIESMFFPAIFTFNLGLDWHKPSSLPFEKVAQTIGGNSERYIYVADNAAKDFAGATVAGWRTVQIVRTGSVHKSVPNQGSAADYIIYDLRELLPLLGMEVTP